MAFPFYLQPGRSSRLCSAKGLSISGATPYQLFSAGFCFSLEPYPLPWRCLVRAFAGASFASRPLGAFLPLRYPLALGACFGAFGLSGRFALAFASLPRLQSQFIKFDKTSKELFFDFSQKIAKIFLPLK